MNIQFKNLTKSILLKFLIGFKKKHLTELIIPNVF